MEDLARRAVACPRWRWLPGMLTTTGYLITVADPSGAAGVQADDWWPKARGLEQWSGLAPWARGEILPDLTDPATVGALLALVREAWGCPHLSVVGTSEDWRIDAAGGPVGIRDLHSYPSEAAALVAALEAAP